MDDSLSAEDFRKLRSFLLDQILRDPSCELTRTTPLVSSGLVDSFAVVDIALFLEEAFGVTIPDYGLNDQVLETAEAMLDYVQTLRPSP